MKEIKRIVLILMGCACLLMMSCQSKGGSGTGTDVNPTTTDNPTPTEGLPTDESKYTVYPSDDYKNAKYSELPDICYTTKGSENGLEGNIYYVFGKVESVENIEGMDCITLLTSKGKVLGCYEQIAEGMAYVPKQGELLKMYVVYIGFSDARNCPAVLFGIPEVISFADYGMNKAEFGELCQYDLTYDMLSRYPEKYKNTPIFIMGKVIQSIVEKQSDGTVGYTFRVKMEDIDGNSGTVLVYYEAAANDARILEGDEIVVFGIFCGDYTYESVMGSKITVPYIKALLVANTEDN